MSDDQTLQVYGEKAQDYANFGSKHLNGEGQLDAFIRALPAGGKALDLGCGPGAAAAAMAAAGLDAHAWDPVPEMVALAGSYAGVTAEVRSFDMLSGEAEWDGIWASFSLLHAPRTDMPGHLTDIHRALTPGGRFHVSVKTGAGAARDKLGRLYTYYSEAELDALLTAAGFSIIHRVTGADAGLSGEVSPWVQVDAVA
ncbi:MAG: class I SAM-dependent methyltransferase [Pseudomonadota bacterium]